MVLVDAGVWIDYLNGVEGIVEHRLGDLRAWVPGSWTPWSFAEKYWDQVSWGTSSQVLPSSNRPVFFLFFPPHCLKKNATPSLRH